MESSTNRWQPGPRGFHLDRDERRDDQHWRAGSSSGRGRGSRGERDTRWEDGQLQDYMTNQRSNGWRASSDQYYTNNKRWHTQPGTNTNTNTRSAAIGAGMSRSTRNWTAEKSAKQKAELPYGLVSRVDGDQRLKDPKVQEEFWSSSVRVRYQAELFKLLAKEEDEMSSALSSLSLDGESGEASTGEKGVLGVLSDLRKLREGIIASHRHDTFALTIYEANVRLAVLAGKAEQYMPPLRGLVFGFGRGGSGDPEFEEMYLLHLICSFEFQEFYSTTPQLGSRNTFAHRLAHALMHSNYISYRRLYTAANPYQRAIMRRAEPRVRERCLDVVGKVYYTVDVQDLGRWTNEGWKGKGWREEGGKVVVREIRRK